MKILKRKSVSPPPILRRPAPALYFHSLCLIFQIPPSGGGNQNLLPSPFKEGGGGVTNYAFGTIPQEPWQPGKGAKPDHMIHLNCREVCTYSSFKTTRTWENFNDRGTKMILLSGKPWLIANNSKSFALFGTFENIVTDVML